MATISFCNVSKYFNDDNYGLRHFSLDIEDGELMVFVGPSGCGKSTALRLLAGLETVSEGEVKIDHVVVNQQTPQQRNVAMVFQNYALYPHMTVRDNLAFPLKMSHTPKPQIENKVAEIGEILNLGELLNRKPKQLSGGQRQRVAMGRALVRDPSVFLLDEPLSNLDAKLRAKIRADIANIQRRIGKTTLYVTHDQVEAMTLGHRVAVMNQGKLQQVGTPAELYQQPGNIFVAKFIGNPGMNIIPSRISGEGGKLAVSIGRHSIPLSPSVHQCIADINQYRDQSVWLGFRPEAVTRIPGPESIAMAVNIQSVEFLGHETLVYFQLPQQEQHNTEENLIARFEGRFSNDKLQQTFYINGESLYLFAQDGTILQRIQDLD